MQSDNPTLTTSRANSGISDRAMNQPVDWYPWGADAFKRAKELHRPILLDVGAVWCPWCTLMDRDTYTNVDTATYINQHFVAVKVDVIWMQLNLRLNGSIILKG